MQRRTRRPVIGLVATGLAAALAACSGTSGGAGGGGGGGDDAGSGEQVELRLAWWGADARHEATQEVIDLFEAEHPDITVVGDFSDWGGYWDRLATATAGGDMPDVMQMDGQYLATYADRGALLDLRGTAVGTDAIDEAALAAGEVDGGLYGVVNAVNSWAVVTNRTLLEAAGVEVPDDTTWTWDDLASLAAAVSAAGVDGAVGLQDYALTQGTIDQFARQQGEDLWTADGDLGVSEETMVAYWELALELLESGALPSAAAQNEALGVTQDQSGTATNRAAFGFWWSNQLGALQATSGQDLVLLRPPLDEDGDRGIWYRPSQFWSASASSEHPEEAALLVDFLVNSSEAGEVLLAERGTPANVEVREAVRPLLSEQDQAIAEYLDAIAEELDGVATLPPAGSSDFESTLRRYTSEVYFGSMTPEQAAPAFLTEVRSALS